MATSKSDPYRAAIDRTVEEFAGELIRREFKKIDVPSAVDAFHKKTPLRRSQLATDMFEKGCCELDEAIDRVLKRAGRA